MHDSLSVDTDEVARELIALARDAHLKAATVVPLERAYWLGQQAGYAEAAGRVMAPGVDQAAFAIGRGITAALAEGRTQLDELMSRARNVGGLGPMPAPTTPRALEWTGPLAFRTRHPGPPGVDRDFGDHWGVRHDQRVSFRHDLGATSGLLYAFDPLRDEYTVLATAIPESTVEQVVAHAVVGGRIPTVEHLATLVTQAQAQQQIQGTASWGAAASVGIEL